MEVDEQARVAETQKRSRAETIHTLFSSFGSELDSHVSSDKSKKTDWMIKRLTLPIQYDRRERINKLSKDITALSKKLIFTLHR